MVEDTSENGVSTLQASYQDQDIVIVRNKVNATLTHKHAHDRIECCAHVLQHQPTSQILQASQGNCQASQMKVE